MKLTEWAIYTAVIDNYDLVFKPVSGDIPADHILFSNNGRCYKGWDCRPVTVSLPGPQANRWYKFFAHRELRDYEYSVYVDGNIRIKSDISPLIRRFIDSRAAIGVFQHRDRSTVADERDACLRYGKLNGSEVNLAEEQLRFYFEDGMPPDQLMTDNGVIFRWHRHPSLEQMMDLWWEQLQRYTKRDQLSLPYVVWKTESPVHILGSSFRSPNPWLLVYPHRGGLLRNVRTTLMVLRECNRAVNGLYLVLRRLKRAFVSHAVNGD